MSPLRLKHHADLVDRMAATRGIDLEEAALRGHLTTPEISDLVLNCTGCTQTDICEKWLAEQAGAVSAAPHYCRNSQAFRVIANRLG